MTSKIEIPRELAKKIADWYDGSYGGRIIEEMGELRALLAAPEAPRQEPAAYIVEAVDPNNGNLRRRGLHWHSVETLRETRDFKEWIGENITREQPLYAAPLSPDHSGGAGVVLPEREEFEEWRDRRNAMIADDGGSASWYVTQAHYATWEACLDKVKELNQ